MNLPVYIRFQGMEPSDALTITVDTYAHELESIDSMIIACWVGIRLEQEHGRHPYSVRIDLKIPGHELVVDRVQHEDAYVAIRDAFQDMKRQLQDVMRREHETQSAMTIPGQLMTLDDTASEVRRGRAQ